MLAAKRKKRRGTTFISLFYILLLVLASFLAPPKGLHYILIARIPLKGCRSFGEINRSRRKIG